jgi:type 1 glutamine amidotransferase
MNYKTIALMFMLVTAGVQVHADGRLKVLILTGESDSLYHHWQASTPFLRQLLERSGRFEVKVEEQVPGITPATLRPFDVLVLNYLGPRWGAVTENAVEEFVRGGKGMISFHGVTYGPFYGMVFDRKTEKWSMSAAGHEDWTAYPSLIGARWDPAKLGHGARHVFPVQWVDQQHPISRGMPSTFLANDELYHRLELLPGTTVLATAFSDPATGGTGNNEPIIWVVRLGSGRTVHLTLGHDLSAMSQPGFESAFVRGTEWAATGQVTLPANIAASEVPKNPVRVLAVTGGHNYPVSFYSLFEGYDDITWSHAASPKEAFTSELAKRFDVIVLYDMWEDLEPTLRENLRAFVEAGKGVVSTHHAIVGYTGWPWWYEEIIGGKYFTKEQPGHPVSAYREGVELVVNLTKAGAAHPVTREVGPLVVDDEAYRGMWHSPKIEVLMETDNPLNDRPVVYVGPRPKARVIYIQLGHSDSTMHYPGYRRLMRNAILWGAGRLQ